MGGKSRRPPLLAAPPPDAASPQHAHTPHVQGIAAAVLAGVLGGLPKTGLRLAEHTVLLSGEGPQARWLLLLLLWWWWWRGGGGEGAPALLLLLSPSPSLPQLSPGNPSHPLDALRTLHSN